jgi:cell division protein FtsB
LKDQKTINKQIRDAEQELAALDAKRTALEENHAASGPEVINCR